MDRIYPPRKNRPIPVVALTSDPVCHGMTGRTGSTSQVDRSPRLIQRIDLGPSRDTGRGLLLEFNVGSHPGDSTHYVNAKDLLSLSLLHARLIDLKLPIKLERSK